VRPPRWRGHGPAEIAAAFGDTSLREALQSDDWSVRERAQQQWSAKFQAAFGDVAPEPAGPSEARGLPERAIPDEMRSAPYHAQVPGDCPPSADGYVSPQSFQASPAVERVFKEFCYAGQFSQAEAIGLVEVLDRFDREGANPAGWPAHLQEARSKLMAEAFEATPEGRATLARARSVFRQMEQDSPDMALILRHVGADLDEGVIKVLASLYRG
jgi:hypothetical protein